MNYVSASPSLLTFSKILFQLKNSPDVGKIKKFFKDRASNTTSQPADDNESYLQRHTKLAVRYNLNSRSYELPRRVFLTRARQQMTTHNGSRNKIAASKRVIQTGATGVRVQKRQHQNTKLLEETRGVTEPNWGQ